MGNAHRKSLYFARFVVKFGFDFLCFTNYFFALSDYFSPSGVSDMRLEGRSKITEPSSFSSSFIALDKLVGATKSSSAALLSDPAFATATACFKYITFTLKFYSISTFLSSKICVYTEKYKKSNARRRNPTAR